MSIDYFKVLSQNLLGGTDENHDMLGLDGGDHEISKRVSGTLGYRITKFVLLKQPVGCIRACQLSLFHVDFVCGTEIPWSLYSFRVVRCHVLLQWQFLFNG